MRGLDQRLNTSIAKARRVIAFALSGMLALLTPLVAPTSILAADDAWTTNGPVGASIEALVVDPQTPSTLYAGASTGGAYKSVNRGASWSPIHNGFATQFGIAGVRALAVDPQAPRTLYAATGDGAYKTINGGGGWSPINAGLPSFPSVSLLAIDPQTPSTLYVGIYGQTTKGIFKSTSGGAGWLEANSGLPTRQVQALAIDPRNPSILYVEIQGSGLYKSGNGGQSWVPMNTGLGSHNVLSLAVDPQTSGVVYAGTGDGLYKTTTGGTNWDPINTGLTGDATLETVLALAITPTAPNVVYAGTARDGVFRTTDGGAHWTAVNSGLPPAAPSSSRRVPALAVDLLDLATVYAGYVDGVYSIDQPALAGDLALSLSIAPDLAVPGSMLALAFTLANTGPSTAGASVTAPIPAGTTFQSVVAADWTCTTPAVDDTGAVVCSRPTVPIGNGVVTVNVRATTAGTVVATGSVSVRAHETNVSNNTVTTTSVIQAACQPRPQVKVITGLSPGGLLGVTVAAQTTVGTNANALSAIRVTGTTNGELLLNGTPLPVGQTILLAGAPQTLQLRLRRVTVGQASMARFVVTDVCGDWPTFVGGGADAF
jgi:photosystem II stability/assembly factor-like uncharacterized protein